MNDQVEQNKRNAQGFYDLMFNQCKPQEAVDKYVGDVYIQHNPHVGDGKEAFVEYFEASRRDPDDANNLQSMGECMWLAGTLP